MVTTRLKARSRGDRLRARRRSESGLGDKHPVYIAGQFYGAVRCSTLAAASFGAAGDDTTFFEVLYTKLIRHVSQGRLLAALRAARS